MSTQPADTAGPATTQLWVNQNGMVACTWHAGHYLTEAVSADPSADEHFTSLDHWMSLSSIIDQVYAPYDPNYECESC